MTLAAGASGRNPCVAVLGGSFDPVHQGHVALAQLFASLLRPDALRILPAGQPWQKNGLEASDADRVAMLELAFASLRSTSLPVTIDLQEIERRTPTYTVETLRALRAELGPRTSIVFLMGADQLRKLDSWNEWRELFALANLGVATRPGYDLAQEALPPVVAQELSTRLATPDTVRLLAHGKVCLAPTLDVDLSSSQLRAALQSGADASALGMAQVLDYIQQHNLYKN
ncbi:nicotinate-nucleotide adenylyltransferase [Massilia timonae]|uniref:Probable nicotinate-nucleotide adenylyltransferase n=1 Tax=Massilia timonae CCUG 45783 TaxID=883126 RepID=K9DIZ4_9BURK|nr:nicotinate (nicotinamide) nucleotide adenylyltransferase [Massilia timonae CCUG 45783]